VEGEDAVVDVITEDDPEEEISVDKDAEHGVI
jgi:hypothetical protein